MTALLKATIIAVPFSPVQIIALLSGFVGTLLSLGFGILWMHKRLHAPVEFLANMDFTPVPLSALQDSMLRLKAQEKELQQLRRDADRRDDDNLRITQDLLGHLPSGVIFFDKQGRVQQANPAARSALGFASPVGLRASELFRNAQVKGEKGEVLGLARELILHSLRSGATLRRKDLDYQTPTGEPRPLGLTFSPMQRNGEITGLLCLLTDLTEVRALEDELGRRRSMASLGEMAAGIAHEFKNALATISGYAQMICVGERDPELQAHAHKILEQVQSISGMTTQFLTFAKPLTINPEDVDLNKVITRAIEAVRVQDSGNIVRIEKVGDFPPVIGDSLLLENVFINLLRNACEAIREQKMGTFVRVTPGRAENSRLEIRVSDDGPGVPRELMEKIFIPFFTTKASGTGLGLAMVHKIVTAHGGNLLLAQSAPGDTVFSITLPMSAQAVASESVSTGEIPLKAMAAKESGE